MRITFLIFALKLRERVMTEKKPFASHSSDLSASHSRYFPSHTYCVYTYIHTYIYIYIWYIWYICISIIYKQQNLVNCDSELKYGHVWGSGFQGEVKRFAPLPSMWEPWGKIGIHDASKPWYDSFSSGSPRMVDPKGRKENKKKPLEGGSILLMGMGGF